MPLISPRGSPSARIWIILERPLSTDPLPQGKGYCFSGGLGFMFIKMLSEAGLNIDECYVTCRKPDLEKPLGCVIVENDLNSYQPPLILVAEEAASYFLPDLQLKGDQESFKTQLNKYVGSLLKSPFIKYDHYMMPIYGPVKCSQDYTERNITTYVDLGKIHDELTFWRKHGTLQPLRARTLLSHDMDTSEILCHLERFSKAKYLSEDIETVYPRSKDSLYGKHPGYPITFGIADSPGFGISFNLFRETPAATRTVWRALDEINSSAQIIGQNFFLFDSRYIEALGFRLRRESFNDTLIRHHILWPELPHKLQFLCRQYTRQPFYKDEGKRWSMKQIAPLRHYNCLDVCVTYEVFEGQEEEFKAKPHLAA